MRRNLSSTALDLDEQIQTQSNSSKHTKKTTSMVSRGLRLPKQTDYRDLRAPAILQHHHNQSQVTPQAIIYSYNYPYSRKNMEYKERQAFGTPDFFNKRNLTTGQVSRQGQRQIQSRPDTRAFPSTKNSQYRMVVSPGSLTSGVTNSTFAQQQVSKLVDLKELYQHYKRLQVLMNYFASKYSEQSIQRILNQYQKVVQNEKLSSYKDLFQSQEKQKTLNEFQCLETLFIYFIDLTLTELLGLYPSYAKYATQTILYYLSQNFLCMTEIILYRISQEQRNNKWAQFLIEIVAYERQRNVADSTVTVSQIQQKQCLKDIKTNNEIIRDIFLNKILKAKVKSFSTNFINYLNKIEVHSPQKLHKILSQIYVVSKQKQQAYSSHQDEYTDDDITDFDHYYNSAFDVPISQNNDQQQSNQQSQEDEIKNYQSQLKTPYLPKLPQESEKTTYTLVLDLDETLVHFTQEHEIQNEKEEQQEQSLQGIGQAIKFRPYLFDFLHEMVQYYEIVIYTAAMQDYADYILDKIDPENQIFSYRLYRQHATVTNGIYFVKDLSKLGRDLKRVIILDNLKENFSAQKENGIFVQTWINDSEDKELVELIPLLKQIVINQVSDVRVSLRQYRDSIIRYIQQNRDININGIQIE